MYLHMMAVWVTNLTLILGEYWTAKVQRGVRCTDVIHSSITSTHLQCFSNCLKTFECCSVNYIKKQNVCEFCRSDTAIKMEKAVTYKYIGYTINKMKHEGSNYANRTPCYACAEYFRNVQFTVNMTKDGDVKTFKCNDNALAETEVTEATCQYSNNQWSSTKLTCRETCFDKTNIENFNEPISTLTNGGKCEKWDKIKSFFLDQYFIGDGKSTAAAQNYCRHPALGAKDSFPAYLYCVPEANLIDFALCGVRRCDSTDLDQCGPPPILPTPAVRSYPLVGDVYLANYRCSKLSGDISTPHCPVSRCIGNNKWTTPSVSCSTKDCFPAGKPYAYVGKRSCTESGRTCLAWAVRDPHSQGFPLKYYPASENFCRGNLHNRPWCFTTDPATMWEYCSVPEC